MRAKLAAGDIKFKKKDDVTVKELDPTILDVDFEDGHSLRAKHHKYHKGVRVIQEIGIEEDVLV
jgi:hypothetical protein